MFKYYIPDQQVQNNNGTPVIIPKISGKTEHLL